MNKFLQAGQLTIQWIGLCIWVKSCPTSLQTFSSWLTGLIETFDERTRKTNLVSFSSKVQQNKKHWWFDVFHLYSFYFILKRKTEFNENLGHVCMSFHFAPKWNLHYVTASNFRNEFHSSLGNQNGVWFSHFSSLKHSHLWHQITIVILKLFLKAKQKPKLSWSKNQSNNF